MFQHKRRKSEEMADLEKNLQKKKQKQIKEENKGFSQGKKARAKSVKKTFSVVAKKLFFASMQLMC